MDGAAGTPMRRTRLAAVLAALLCGFALVAGSAAAAAGSAHAGSHVVKIAAVTSTGQHAVTTRLDDPQVVGTDRPAGCASPSGPATATSSTIVSPATVGSPRTRGPPAQGCF